MHVKGRSDAAESQDGHCHFGSRLDTRESSLETTAHYSQQVVTCKKRKIRCSTSYHCIHWWHLTSKALFLVLKKRIWGVVGNFLKEEKGRTDNRIVLLRVNWAGRGRELRELDKIKRSV